MCFCSRVAKCQTASGFAPAGEIRIGKVQLRPPETPHCHSAKIVEGIQGNRKKFVQKVRSVFVYASPNVKQRQDQTPAGEICSGKIPLKAPLKPFVAIINYKSI